MLDLRDKAERARHGEIPGSVHAPYPELDAHVGRTLGVGRSPPRTPIRGRRSFDWTSRAKDALLWGNGPEGCASGPPAPTG